MTTVPGDPASLSSCAAAAAALSRRLEPLATGLDADVSALGDGWPGRRSVETRRRGASVAAGLGTTADELEAVATLLQDQATDLAGLVARARTVDERAAAAGLAVVDGRVVPAPGIRGAADPATERARDELGATLQGELDLVLAQHRRRRDFVLGALERSTARLAEASAALRR